LIEGLSDTRCGADGDVTRTLERVIEGFLEALEERQHHDPLAAT
jgi:hypothetical protein